MRGCVGRECSLDSFTENDAPRSGLGVLFSIAAVVSATLVAGYAMSQAPRGFRMVMTFLIVCWIELIFGLLAYWRRVRRNASSGATFAILLTTTGSYALVGLTTVITFVAIRGGSSEQDGILFGMLLLETVLFFVIVHRLIQHDSAAKEETQRLERIHAHRVDESDLIAQSADRLKQSRSVDLTEQRRLDTTASRLYAVQVSLLHSHSGFSGASTDVEVGSIGDAIAVIASGIQSGNTLSEALTEIERLTDNLEILLRLHRIS